MRRCRCESEPAPVPMAAHVFPVCERGVTPGRFRETIMEILLHEAQNRTDHQYQTPRGITLLLLLCLVLLLVLWNHNIKRSSVPGPVPPTAY
ncbi:Aromatase [Bagarius yarrelli]|uniref:Aromatase n=1 Tax=Bagarius yarrelli TaxID=175774 RepID=A0A556VWR9_BAGYA|nr:Aromatase [Bagarius yarrelli]